MPDALRTKPGQLHIVMFSGGIGSWCSAHRVIEEHGRDNVILLFADVGGTHPNPHVGEDSDCYRFINEAGAALGAELVILNSAETIWDVFKRRSFLGNSRQANCSTELKQNPARKWLEENSSPDDTVVIGIDWTETHRIPAVEKAYAPHPVRFPMTEKPYMSRQEMIDLCKGQGVEPPRMYEQGFAHANCQGACVRAGQGQWRQVLQQNPDLFAYAETQEQELRDHLGKDVAILRDWKAGGVPLTLTAFRERQATDQLDMFDADDIGGCGCFVQDATP